MKLSRCLSLLSLGVLLFSLLGPGAQPAAAGGGGVIFTVTSVNEGSDAMLNGICATAGGVCTLRAAIQEANFDPAVNTIWFNLPGGGVHSISISAGPLPTISNQLNLDGTSQPSCSVPCIALSGALLAGGPSEDGIQISSDNSTLKGFILTSWEGYGVSVVGNYNYIQANSIGVWPGNPADLGNGGGISIMGSSNVIGGTSADLRNVISDNTWHGIELSNGCCLATSGNIILGNYIGTNETGMAARGNGGSGILIYEPATYTTIGSTILGSGNVISANGWSGIEVAGSHTIIRGNTIGLRKDGSGSLGNAFDGIRVYGTATANYIGGPGGAAKNKIARNGWNGIMITNGGSGRTTIRRNSIFLNVRRGIDIGNDGVTPNDPFDADNGPNGRQNFPILPSAASGTGVIIAKLYSKPFNSYTIDFYSSPAGTCDPSNHGEGRVYLGSKSGVTDGAGYVRIRFVSPIPFAAGSAVTATASDSTGRTSEFSKCRVAQ